MERVRRVLTAIALGLGSVLIFPALGEKLPLPAIGMTQRWADLAQAQSVPIRFAQRQEQILQALELTPAQLREIRAIQQRYEPQLTRRRQALRQAHQELNRLMAGDAPETQIRSKFQQIQQLRQQQATTHFESLLAMRSVLTPAQRRKFAELMQHRQGADPMGRGRRQLWDKPALAK
ncbi:Spy/CpxP family protein refolding chaperone [Trichothermofontia sp.]